MRKKQRLMVAGALVLGLVLGAAALAVAGNSGAIYACVNNDSGTVKIVAEGTDCNENWTLTSWNQQGVPGTDGAQGPAGDDGADGADGAQGSAGDDGADGADGAQGSAGDDGADGADGAQGPASGAVSQVVTGSSSAFLSTAVCPAGTFAIGGGFFMTNDNPPFASYPSTAIGGTAPAGAPAPAWSVIKATTNTDTVTAYAICAP